MLSHFFVAAVALSQLETAVIHATVFDSTARIEATYGIRSDTDSLRFTIIRIRGQDMRLTSTSPDLTTRHEAPGALKLTLAVRALESSRVTLQYEIRGELSRIPLFVPDTPTDPGASNVAIRIDGLAPSVRLSDGFPRLFRQTDGRVVAQPNNVPSFVRIPRGGQFTSVSRASDVFVILLVVGSSVLWMLGGRRRRRAAALPR